jgi:general L-amino acid transport system substrate-binding protein
MSIRVCFVLLLGLWQAARAGDVLDRVRAAQTLRCGVIGEMADENKTDSHGNLAPLASEICRAVSVSLFGKDAAQISLYHVEAEGLAALRSGKVDLVAGVTPTPHARVEGHVTFGPVFFWDSLAIMAHTEFHIEKLDDIKGKKLCSLDQTDAEALTSWALVQRGIRYIPFTFQEEGEMESALLTGHCQAFVGPMSKLGEIRATYGGKVADTVILPDRLALLPAAIAYRDGDDAFGAIADWTVYALVQAETLGMTKANVASFRTSANVLAERLTGIDPAGARSLGLPPSWASTLIGTMGNYGEIFERTVGGASPMGLARGLNTTWENGGLMAPMPLQ